MRSNNFPLGAQLKAQGSASPVWKFLGMSAIRSIYVIQLPLTERIGVMLHIAWPLQRIWHTYDYRSTYESCWCHTPQDAYGGFTSFALGIVRFKECGASITCHTTLSIVWQGLAMQNTRGAFQHVLYQRTPHATVFPSIFNIVNCIFAWLLSLSGTVGEMSWYSWYIMTCHDKTRGFVMKNTPKSSNVMKCLHKSWNTKNVSI